MMNGNKIIFSVLDAHFLKDVKVSEINISVPTKCIIKNVCMLINL